MIYRLIKRVIKNGYDKFELMTKIENYRKADRITEEEYNELVDMLN